MSFPIRQLWNAEQYAATARFVSDLATPVVSLLDAKPEERILDIGCGDGALTALILASGAEVVAIDSSSDMAEAARHRGLDARVMDGCALTFPDQMFDAVFSNAALHWILDPEVLVKQVFRVLKPGGRFVGEFGGFANVAAAVTALTAVLERRGIDARLFDPWYFPTAEAYRECLERAGLAVSEIALFPRLTRLDAGIGKWLEMFFQNYLCAVPSEDRRSVVEEAAGLLAPSLRTPDGVWYADYVRLRFRAVKNPA